MDGVNFGSDGLTKINFGSVFFFFELNEVFLIIFRFLWGKMENPGMIN